MGKQYLGFVTVEFVNVYDRMIRGFRRVSLIDIARHFGEGISTVLLIR